MKTSFKNFILNNFITRIFYLDYRSMALGRILTGIFLLLDLISNMQYIDVFFGNQGVFPRKTLIKVFAHKWTSSLFYINGSQWFVYLLLTLYVLFLISFILGYKTRLSTFITWIFLVSIHNANWGVLNGGDDLIRSVFLIFCFLPLGKRISIDSFLSKPNTSNIHLSYWNITLYIQLSLMYIVSALFKNHHIWNESFTALKLALKLDAFTTNLAQYVLPFDSSLKVITAFTYYSEKFAPFLIFLALFRLSTASRYFLISLFLGFHLSIEALMNVGYFAFLAIAVWCVFIPSHFWDKVINRFFERPRNSFIIYYDADCGFCKKMAIILKNILKLDTSIYMKAQSNSEVNELMQKENSWVLRDETGKYHTHFDGLLILIENSFLKKLTPFFTLPFMRKLGDYSYRLVANNRKFFSKISALIKITPYKKQSNSLFVNILAIYFLTCIVYWNARAYNSKKIPYSKILTTTNRALSSYQSWKLFAPYPKKTNVWFYVEGTTKERSLIDLIEPESFIAPLNKKQRKNRYSNKMNRKFMMRLESKKSYRKALAKYYCQKWNKNARTKELLEVQILMGKERNYTDKPSKLLYDRKEIFSMKCP